MLDAGQMQIHPGGMDLTPHTTVQGMCGQHSRLSEQKRPWDVAVCTTDNTAVVSVSAWWTCMTFCTQCESWRRGCQ